MNTSQMTDLDLIYNKEFSSSNRREEIQRRSEFTPRFSRKLLSLGLEHYYRVPQYKNIKPEQIRHLTDYELLLIDIDETNFDAWKKEYETRNRLDNIDFRGCYLTRKEFNVRR